ncbi:hypothetical protein TWF730_000274 [Orbilia blumenaviensis]|uniref:Uncharacterized protein n=1 Tax=Orbilia blumenaviensis TaxID=1796055 RepID=A0AAV9VL18_9PEZI
MAAIRRKPLPNADHGSVSEGPPPPYHFNENAVAPTVATIKPLVSHVENMAVESMATNDGSPRNIKESEAKVVNVRGVQENCEAGLKEVIHGEGSKATLKNEALQKRGHENVEGQLPRPPLPQTVPRVLAPIRAVPPLIPPPRKFDPPRPPPKELRRPQNSSPSVAGANSKEVEEKEDDGNASDGSDDSYVVARRQIFQVRKAANGILAHKRHIIQLIKEECWYPAVDELEDLIVLVEDQGHKVPVEWYLEVVRLSLCAERLPYIRQLPSNIGEIDEENGRDRGIWLESAILRGFVAKMEGQLEQSISWFLKAAKFARKYGYSEEIDICCYELCDAYTESGKVEEGGFYRGLITGRRAWENGILKYLKPRVFKDEEAMSQSLVHDRCLSFLDELLLMRGVAKNEEKKEKYRQILHFASVAGAKGRGVSAATIADVFNMKDNEVFEMIKSTKEGPNSGSGVFRLREDAETDVMLEYSCMADIISRSPRSPWAKHKYFSADEGFIMSDLAPRLLGLMRRLLKEDICQVKAYGTSRTAFDEGMIKKCIPSSLRYACRWWLEPYADSKLGLKLEELQTFVGVHWLNWIEVMGILGPQMMDQARSMAVELRQELADSERGKTLTPASRKRIELMEIFLNRYGDIILETPLQVYHLWKLFEFEENAAALSAPKVLIKIDIHDSQNQHAIFKTLKEGYDNLLKIVKPGMNERQKIAFSSDLRLVAYNIPDSPIVIVKDLTTKSEGIILEHGKKRVFEIHFSPKVAEDNTLAIITDPPQVTVWDISKAATKQIFAAGKPNEHLTIKFSPNGGLIAFISGRRNIIIRNIDTGGAVHGPYDGGPGRVLSMDFLRHERTFVIANGYRRLKTPSPDLTALTDIYTWSGGVPDDASVHVLNGKPKKALVWAKEGGAFIRTLLGSERIDLDCGEKGGKRIVMVVSHDEKRIAAIRDKGGIQIFDSETGKCIQSFWRFNGETTLAAAFLPSGDRLITVSKEMGMREWELTVGVEVDAAGEWVVRGDEKVMRIPRKYHARGAGAERSNGVVLTHPSGRVLEVEFTISKERAAEETSGYGLVTTVMAYLPSLPVSLNYPSLPSLPWGLPTFRGSG